MALLLAKVAVPQAAVLVDTGHHYQGQNIEQIVAWLLHMKMMGGFHFNDRRYADDDLTLGSIDPYQIFRIFHEIRMFEWETQSTSDIAYMVDQSHNLKGKIEAMIQTVCTAQELYARASLVDQSRLANLQRECSLVDAEETLRGAFWQGEACRKILCWLFAPAVTWKESPGNGPSKIAPLQAATPDAPVWVSNRDRKLFYRSCYSRAFQHYVHILGRMDQIIEAIFNSLTRSWIATSFGALDRQLVLNWHMNERAAHLKSDLE
jgi:hypothetical protein